MINQHEFDSVITQKQEFDSHVVNAHSFDSTIRNNHVFESIVNGFVASTSWFAKFTSDTAINIGLIKTTTRIFGQFSSISGLAVDRLLMNTNLKPRLELITLTAISFAMKIRQNFGIADFASPTILSVRMRDLLKIGAPNPLTTVTGLQAVFSNNKYYLVSDWDASLLSTLDTMLLEDMDYQVV